MSEFTTLFSFIMSPAEIKPSLTGELTQQQVFKLDHRETDVALKADDVHVRRESEGSPEPTHDGI